MLLAFTSDWLKKHHTYLKFQREQQLKLSKHSIEKNIRKKSFVNSEVNLSLKFIHCEKIKHMIEMAESPVSVMGKDLKTGEKIKEEDDLSGVSKSIKTNSSNIEIAVGIEDVHIYVPPKDEEIVQSSDKTAEETEQLSSLPVSLNVTNTVYMRRRIGVVEMANGEEAAERRKARVLLKKFGEGMVHEMPSVFNKKL